MSFLLLFTNRLGTVFLEPLCSVTVTR